jgi:single-stranded DNA-binding protein
VEGKLKQIRWTSSDGKWRSMVKIIGKSIQVQQKQKRKKKREIKPFKIEF